MVDEVTDVAYPTQAKNYRKKLSNSFNLTSSTKRKHEPIVSAKTAIVSQSQMSVEKRGVGVGGDHLKSSYVSHSVQ